MGRAKQYKDDQAMQMHKLIREFANRMSHTGAREYINLHTHTISRTSIKCSTLIKSRHLPPFEFVYWLN
ncbi:MAG: hypothetical protein RL660_1780 [Bacteroidota bacterium]|jgi:hypothetical protein